MKVELMLPLSIAMGLVSYTLIAKWYLMPWLASFSRREALIRLVLVHTFRYLGLAFLIPGAPPSIWTPVLPTRLPTEICWPLSWPCWR